MKESRKMGELCTLTFLLQRQVNKKVNQILIDMNRFIKNKMENICENL